MRRKTETLALHGRMKIYGIVEDTPQELQEQVQVQNTIFFTDTVVSVCFFLGCALFGYAVVLFMSLLYSYAKRLRYKWKISQKPKASRKKWG